VLDPGVDFLLTTFLEHIVEIHISVDKVRARFDEHLCVIAENKQKNCFLKICFQWCGEMGGLFFVFST